MALPAHKTPGPHSQTTSQLRNKHPVYRGLEKTVLGALAADWRGQGTQTHTGLGQHPNCVILGNLSPEPWFPHL